MIRVSQNNSTNNLIETAQTCNINKENKKSIWFKFKKLKRVFTKLRNNALSCKVNYISKIKRQKWFVSKIFKLINFIFFTRISKT